MPDVHLKDATEYPRRVAWVGATAPTTDTSITVGPGTLWVDTSSTPFVWKVRNTGDTGWDTIGVAGTPTSIANAGGSVVVNGSGQVTVTAPSGQDIRLFGPTGESVRTVHGVGAVLNGASNAYVQALNDDSVGMGGGPAGAAGAFVDAAGNLLLNGTTAQRAPPATSALQRAGPRPPGLTSLGTGRGHSTRISGSVQRRVLPVPGPM
jgi:hypothetical protein